MYVLASCLAERLGRNKSFATLLHENIFEPLNMKSTTTVGTLLRGGGGDWNSSITAAGEGRERNHFSRDEFNKWSSLSKIYYMNDTNNEIKEIDIDIVR